MQRSRRHNRISAAALAIGLGLTLSACESFDMNDLFPDGKKKLPGERRAVFPGGVPGVPEGVPPELVKGYQAPPEGAVDADAVLAQEEKNPAAKPKPRPRPVAQQPRQQQAAPQQQQQQPSAQWPAQQPAQQSAWPSAPAPAPGTFSR